MNQPPLRIQSLLPTLLIAVAALLSASVLAAQAAESGGAQARYQQEVAACNSGQSNQDRATCLREAGAALAEAKSGALNDGSASYADNQRKRCEGLPGDDRLDCLARMQGRGTTSGSVEQGGILRELVTRETVLPVTAPTTSDTAKPATTTTPAVKPRPMPMPVTPAK